MDYDIFHTLFFLYGRLMVNPQSAATWLLLGNGLKYRYLCVCTTGH